MYRLEIHEGNATLTVGPTGIHADLFAVVQALRAKKIERVTVVAGSEADQQNAALVDRLLYEIGLDVL